MGGMCPKQKSKMLYVERIMAAFKFFVLNMLKLHVFQIRGMLSETSLVAPYSHVSTFQ